MPDYSHSTVAEMKQAYALLQLDLSATAAVIKQSYRRMAGFWHPDKYTPNTSQQALATEKMKAINLAFELIQHAPLRYHIASHPKVSERAEHRSAKRQSAPMPTKEQLRVNDGTEYWVRFVCGAFLGLLVALKLFAHGVPGAAYYFVALPLSLGWLAARYGDDFWYAVMEGFWWRL